MKRILKITGLLILAVNLFSSCSDFSVSDENEKKSVNTAIENINSEIVLGEKFENLFTVEKAQERAVEGEIIEANYMYFRCRSDNEDDIKWLSEKFDVLSIIPLDREILEGGTIYKDPELSEDEAPWFYLMKPIEDYNEVVSRGISAEVLDEMYLDDEDIALLSGEGLEIPDDTYLTVDLEDESARFGGWLKKKLKKIIKKYVANYPKGKVQVLDTITGEYVPVKGVKVMSQQLGLIGIDITGKNGKFSIPRAYTSLGGKVQMMLVFENSNITLNDPEHITNAFGCVVYYEDWHWIEGISDLNIKIGKGEFNQRCATILNAYSDYCDYCSANRITVPTNLSVWTISGMANACTPLLRHTTGTALPSMSNTLTNFLGLPTPSGDRALIPDIVLGTKNATNKELTEDIYSNMFHELSHASHYFGLGSNGRKIWFREYGNMLSGWAKAGLRGENPADNCYDNGGKDLVKLIESWGYFSEHYIMAWKYPPKSFNWNGKFEDYLGKLEKRELDTYKKENKVVRDNSKPYFYYGGLYDLIDTTNEADIDFTANYTYNQLFKALTSSNVDDLKSFANALVRVSNRHSDLQNVIKTLDANHD